MIILAFECSTNIASIAIAQNYNQIDFEQWETSLNTPSNLSIKAKILLARNKLHFDDIQLYALSIGPGSYSGLRIAIATAQGLALPTNTPIFPLPTDLVIAFQVLAKQNQIHTSHITIVGDARRQQLWYKTYNLQEGTLIATTDFVLLNYSDVTKIPPSYIVSPDMEKISDLLKNNISKEHILQTTPEYPSAATVAQLANKFYQNDIHLIKSKKLVPIYMHPAV